MSTGEHGDAANVAGHVDQRRGRVPADTFSNRLLLARALAGHLSIREACERAGLNRGNWQGWERGLRPRDQVEVCRAVAEALDVDFEWLLFGGALEGPRGRPVRALTKRAREDTDRYPALAGRPTPVRPTPGRPKTRHDARDVRAYGVGRPVIVERPSAAERDLVAATA